MPEAISEEFQSIHNQNPVYCSDQIKIPSQLPDILKNFAKYVIKNNPSDIVSAGYE